MVSKKITITNPKGLHVRPATILVKRAEACSSRVEIIYKHNIVNAKSLLNILSAAIVVGDEIELRCIGPEEEKDMEYMAETLKHLE